MSLLFVGNLLTHKTVTHNVFCLYLHANTSRACAVHSNPEQRRQAVTGGLWL